MKGSEITEKLENIKTNKPPQTISVTISINQMIMVIFAIVFGVLLLLVVIFWTSGGSQNRMNDIIELNKIESDKAVREIKSINKTISTTQPSAIDSETNKQLIAQITHIIRQQITVDDIVTKVAHTVSEQTKGIKKDIFNLIKTENDKVEKERKNLQQQVATSKHSQKEAERELTNTNQALAKTTEELVDFKKREERMHNSLESLMLRRFRVATPVGIPIDDLLVKITKQGGTWRWYQQVFSNQYEACAKEMEELQALNNPQCEKITKLLNIDDILQHAKKFVSENPYFETDENLLGRMFAINRGTWLSNVFRADDLLKTYFANIPELKSLATRLGLTAILLQAALEELGVKVIKPELLKKQLAKFPESAYKPTDNTLLIELIHDKVMQKLSDKEPQLVVDIEKYGFITSDHPEPSMTILYADLAGWEGY